MMSNCSCSDDTAENRVPLAEDETDSISKSRDSGDDSDDKIILNVGGMCHETLISTLENKPGTRLCSLARKHVREHGKKEYFFDRHPGVFSSVIDYYRSGITTTDLHGDAGQLHVPLDVCGAVVKRELDWWHVEDSLIEPCCWIKYSKYIDTQQTLGDFNKTVEDELQDYQALQNLTGWKLKQAKIWMVLDYPRSSRLALGYAVTSFLFVVLSIGGFCLETLPDMSSEMNVTRKCGNNEPEDTTILVPDPFLTILDYICTAYFSIEICVRILFAPNKSKFFRNPMNIIDILALLPLYVQNIFEITDRYNCLRSHRAVIETIFILRIIRISRIFHILKHYKALKILVYAIKASVQELLMLSIFLFISMMIFSTMIYYAERPGPMRNTSGAFATIPIGFWWSLITMTTVGYGDVYPETPMGMVVGAICAVAGVLLVALTIPVISNNFALFYTHARTREQIVKKDDEMFRRKSQVSGSIQLERISGGMRKAWGARPFLAMTELTAQQDQSGIMMASYTGSEGAKPANGEVEERHSCISPDRYVHGVRV